MSLRLILFGTPQLERDGTIVSGRAAQRRRIALLMLLARAPRRTLTRDRIVGQLWTEHAPDAARRLLSEAVYIIRRELGEELILANGDDLTLSVDLLCDVDEFHDALAAADYERAVALHRGPFADGWYVSDAPEFERWVEGERAEGTAQYVKALRALTIHKEESSDWEGAATGWQAILRADPYSSSAVRGAAKARVANGEPATALQLLSAHETLLKTDLGVGLDADLTALATAIRDGRLQSQRPVSDFGATAALGVTVVAPATQVPLDEAPSDPVDDPDVRVRPLRIGTTSLEPPASSLGISPTTNRSAAAAPRRGPSQLWRFAAGGVIAVALAAWVIYSRSSAPTAAAQSVADSRLSPLRVAVLYFEDKSPDSSLTFLADGLAEGLIRELSDVQSLRVLSRDAASQYRNTTLSADSIGRALGAGTVISASVQESAGRIRVLARLVDVATGEQTATVQVEQRRGELFSLVDSLALQTSAALRRRLGDVVSARGASRLARDGKRDSRALELLFRAERMRKDAVRVRSSSSSTDALRAARGSLVTADSMLEVAAAIDPSYAEISIARGWVTVAAGSMERGATRVLTLAPGLAHAEHALATVRQFAPNDRTIRASALYLRGLLRTRSATAVQTFRPEGALLQQGSDDLVEAVTLDSSLAGAWAALSSNRLIRGDNAGAEAAAQRAIAADAFLGDAGEVAKIAWRAAYGNADADGAARWCARGRALLPNDWHFVECELTMLRLDVVGLTNRRPDPKRAWALVAQLEAIDPAERTAASGRPYTTIYRRLVAAAVSAAAGQRDSARAVLAAAIAQVSNDSELRTDVLYDAAFVHLALGEQSRARELIAEYLRARPDLRLLIERDPTMGRVLARADTTATR
jgi:DNA-binding SARP family transcriptional activator/TolB-like protein